jgi:hypothetical protein
MKDNAQEIYWKAFFYFKNYLVQADKR